MRKHIKSFVIILICLGLSGCGVESKVTIAQNQILIPPYRENVFEFTTCKKGELVNKLSITCYCRPEEINEMSFGISDKMIQGVYVSVGDMVTQGQLLADIENKEIKESISEIQTKIKEAQAECDFILNKLSVAIKESDKQKLEIERKNNQNRIEVLEKNQRELQTELGKYEIRAPKSGVITKIMETEGNYRSVEGLNFLTVSGENKLFIGETDCDYKFSEEASYEMLIDEISYPCSYLSEELSEDGIRKVIFQLEESEFTLDNPHFGILQIVLGTLEDALYLPKRCIVWIDNKPYVYLIDEYGFKNPNAVILGIEVDDNYQIISGIQEGDRVALN